MYNNGQTSYATTKTFKQARISQTDNSGAKISVRMAQAISCGGCETITSVASPDFCAHCGRTLCGKCGDFCKEHFSDAATYDIYKEMAKDLFPETYPAPNPGDEDIQIYHCYEPECGLDFNSEEDLLRHQCGVKPELE